MFCLILNIFYSYLKLRNLPHIQFFYLLNLGLTLVYEEYPHQIPIFDSDSVILTYVQKCVDMVNSKAISRVTQVKKWKILDRDFSIEGGELTPTLKVKRKVINKLHLETIE